MKLSELDRVAIREFTEEDIENKVKWINDPDNNQFLHYDLPLSVEKTLIWFKNKAKNRLDCVIEYDGVPVGLIGLLGIDEKNCKAEFYISMGEKQYKRKGIAKKAGIIFIEYVFASLDIQKIYLYTEEENIVAQKLFEKLGFVREGLFRSDIIHRGRVINRYAYCLLKEEYDK